jgi:hypothetical protein
MVIVQEGCVGAVAPGVPAADRVLVGNGPQVAIPRIRVVSPVAAPRFQVVEEDGGGVPAGNRGEDPLAGSRQVHGGAAVVGEGGQVVVLVAGRHGDDRGEGIGRGIVPR